MPGAVALDVHGQGQARDMAGMHGNLHIQCRGLAAQTHGSDAELVDGFEQFSLHGRELRVRVGVAEFSEQGTFGQNRCQLESAADAHADDDRRTRVGPGLGHAVHDEVLDPVPALGRSEHGHAGHVLAAPALGHEGDLEPIALDQIKMDDGRSVVLGVGAGEGVAGGLAQKPFVVALAHALVYGLPERHAVHPQILTDLDEEHGQPRILTQGQTGGLGQFIIFGQLPEYLPGRRIVLGGGASRQTIAHVLGQNPVGLDAHPGHVVDDGLCRDGPHGYFRKSCLMAVMPILRRRKPSWFCKGRCLGQTSSQAKSPMQPKMP